MESNEWELDIGTGAVSRRRFLHGALASSAVLATPAFLLGCGDGGEDDGARPRRGGRLRVGIVGGGSSETLDLNQAVNEIDTVRTVALFEGLMDYDLKGNPQNRLARELAPNADASVWKIRLLPGVVFHNGRTMTADDVVYSLRFILDPKNETQGASAFEGFLKASGVRKVDATTVELHLSRPNAFLPELLCGRQIKVFPDGTSTKDLESKPIGTGPFKFVSWKRGERSLFAANREYRVHGGPYVDELEVISINEPGARANALVAGEIDALAQLDPKLIATVRGSGKQVFDNPSGAYTCPYMEVDSGPFRDARVRQAFRLMTNRQQMIDNALQGHGKVANDLFGWFDEDYASDIPQREHDPERARSLLRAAGHEGLKVELATSEVAPAMIESSTLFAEQAKQAGVEVTLKKTPADTYYSGPYMKVPFASTTWPGRPIAEQYIFSMTKASPYNETRWLDPQWEARVREAFSTVDDDKRRELMVASQQTLHDQGGYIIWGFLNNIDAASKQVKGLKTSVLRALGYYDFLDVTVRSA